MRFYSLIISLCCVLVTLAQAELKGSEIVTRAQEVLRVKGVQGVSSLRIIDNKGRERVRKIKMVSKVVDNGETEKRLLRFMAPADVKGTGLLTYDHNSKDDDLWLYMPSLRKVRRIVSSDKAKSFLGSEFTYADMAPPSPDDFTFKLIGEEKIKGVLCFKVEWTPKDDDIAEENGFSKRISFSGKEDFVFRKFIDYDLDGELLKELIVHEIKELDTKKHKFRYMNIEAINKQNGRRSTMVNEKLEFNPNVDDKYFTTGYLERQ